MKKVIYTLLLSFLMIQLYSQSRKTGLYGNNTHNNEVFVAATGGMSYLFGDAYGNPMNHNFWAGKNYTYGASYFQSYKSNIGFGVTLRMCNLYNSDDFENTHSGGFYQSTTKAGRLGMYGEYMIRYGDNHNYFPKNSVGLYSGLSIMYGNVKYGANSYNGGITTFSTIGIPFGIHILHRYENNLSLGLRIELEYGLGDKADGYAFSTKTNKTKDIFGGLEISFGYQIQ